MITNVSEDSWFDPLLVFWSLLLPVPDKQPSTINTSSSQAMASQISRHTQPSVPEQTVFASLKPAFHTLLQAKQVESPDSQYEALDAVYRIPHESSDWEAEDELLLTETHSPRALMPHYTHRTLISHRSLLNALS